MSSTRFSLRSDMNSTGLLPVSCSLSLRERAGGGGRVSFLDFQELSDSLNQLLNIKRLLYNLIRAGLEQVVDLFLIHNTRDDDDFHVLESRILPDRLADD